MKNARLGSNGNMEYSLAIAKISFWDGDIRCELCPCMEVYQRKQCRLTGEYLIDTRTRGYACPLIPVDSYPEWATPEELIRKVIADS